MARILPSQAIRQEVTIMETDAPGEHGHLPNQQTSTTLIFTDDPGDWVELWTERFFTRTGEDEYDDHGVMLITPPTDAERSADVEKISEYLRHLWLPGEVRELRVLKYQETPRS